MSRKCKFSGPLPNKIYAKYPNYTAFAEYIGVHWYIDGFEAIINRNSV